jgi:hypothetical protein
MINLSEFIQMDTSDDSEDLNGYVIKIDTNINEEGLETAKQAYDLIEDQSVSNVTIEDDLDIVINILLKACTVGNICAYSPLSINILSLSSDSGINFAPIFEEDLP